MTDNSFFELRGLCGLLSQLQEAFPASVSIDYLEVCGTSKNKTFDASEIVEIKKLGTVLTMLDELGLACGHFYESSNCRYYWDYRLTVKGFKAASSVLGTSGTLVSASAILSSLPC